MDRIRAKSPGLMCVPGTLRRSVSAGIECPWASPFRRSGAFECPWVLRAMAMHVIQAPMDRVSLGWSRVNPINRREAAFQALGAECRPGRTLPPLGGDMKKALAVVSLLAVLAAPAMAAPRDDDPRGPGSVVSRVVRAIKHFVGSIVPFDDANNPVPPRP